MKKMIAILCIGAAIGSSLTFAASGRFSDVPVDTWYADAVESLSGKGFIKGYSDGTFQPDKSVTRAELAVILDRMLKQMEAEKNTTEILKAAISLTEAKAIAQNISCTQEGNLTGAYSYNSGTKTWWFDMSTQKAGCNPACVVDETTKTASINWRCTGLIPAE